MGSGCELAVSFAAFMLNQVVMSSEHEIQDRLNNGKPLTGYELVRIRAKDLAGIQRMARHPFFDLILSPIMINGRKNEDAVIKMYILLCTSSFSFDKRNIEKVYQTLDVTHDVSA